MRTKNLIALGASIALVLVMVLTGCGQATTAPSTPSAPSTPGAPQVVTKTVEVEKTYKALNPQGLFIPVETKGLAKRLDTIVGKTIYICQGEADPLIMPALYKVMVAKYTNTKFLYYDLSAFGPNVPGTGTTPAKSTGLPEPTDIFTKADACIRGIGW